MTQEAKLDGVRLSMFLDEVIFDFNDDWHMAIRLKKGLTRRQTKEKLLQAIEVLDFKEKEPNAMTTNPTDEWLIVSWQHIDHEDAAYGKMLANFIGTEQEAKEEARKFIPDFKPVGIVRVIK